MTPSCPHEPRSNRLRDVLLWGTAALVMFSAHVSSAAWLLSQKRVEIADDGPPPAIMIDLAAEPEAVNTETMQIAEDVEDSPDVAALTPPEEPPVEEAAVEPPPEPEPEPVEEVTQTVPEPEPEPEPIPPEPQPEEEMANLVEEAAVPLPVARPEPEKPEVKKEAPKPKKVEVKKEKPKEQARPEPSRAAMAAAAEVTQGARNAAAKSASGSSFSSASPARWQSKVYAHLARRKGQLAKTRDRGTQGTVVVRFSIDTGGNVLSVSLSRSSGHPSLDQDVLAMVRNASPVPAPPPDVNRTLTAPFEFTSR